jgi:hypothetical protein
MMYADCSATLENADLEISVVTRILQVTQSILLVVKLPRSLASTFKTMDRASTGMTAAFLTQTVMLQKNQLQMVLLTMREVVVAVEEEGEEEGVAVEHVGEVVVVEDVVVLLRLLLQQQPLLLALLPFQVPLLKRRTMRNK